MSKSTIYLVLVVIVGSLLASAMGASFVAGKENARKICAEESQSKLEKALKEVQNATFSLNKIRKETANITDDNVDSVLSDLNIMRHD